MSKNSEILRFAMDRDVVKEDIYKLVLETKDLDIIPLAFDIQKKNTSSDTGVRLINFCLKNGWNISKSEFENILGVLPLNNQIYCFKYGFKDYISLEQIELFLKTNEMSEPLFINFLSYQSFSELEKDRIEELITQNKVSIGFTKKAQLLEISEQKFLESLLVAKDIKYLENIQLLSMDYLKKTKEFRRKYSNKKLKKSLVSLHIETLPRLITMLQFNGLDRAFIIKEINRYINFEQIDLDFQITDKVNEYFETIKTEQD